MSWTEYLRTEDSYWYWSTMILSLVTVITVLTISDGSALIYLRYFLGAFMVLFLPGYSLVRALFPVNAESSKRLDAVAQVALAFGSSIALAAITGLILNYLPWGVQLTPIISVLFSLTVVLTTVAARREYRIMTSKQDE